MFTLKCPADTEDEALVGISSEDEAEDMDLDLAIAHRAVRQAPILIVGTSGVLSAKVMSMPAATGPVPGPEEVIMKKAALVTVQKQMAALVRGEDLLAREVQDVPYVVPVVGGEDTKCPICHLVFMTPYQLREHMDVHRGGKFPNQHLIRSKFYFSIGKLWATIEILISAQLSIKSIFSNI